MIALDDRLRSEARICPRCHYRITSPFNQSCPRCLTVLAVIDPGCKNCIHFSRCPVANAPKVESKLA